MPTVTPHGEPTATSPAVHPTHPVAGQRVDTDTPSFDWTPLPDAEAYRLQLASTEEFETIHYDETVARSVSVDLRSALPDGATTVYWRVAPAKAPEDDPWSEAAHFVRPSGAVDEAVVVDAEPVPTHPASGTAVDASAAAFVWEGVPEASGYQLQVASEDESVVDLTLDQTTSVVLYDVLPEEQDALRWRVRPLFPNGETGPWSPVLSFATAPVGEEGREPDAPSAPAPTEQSSEPETIGVADGPARQARTSAWASVGFILLIVVGFLLAVGLTVLNG